MGRGLVDKSRVKFKVSVTKIKFRILAIGSIRISVMGGLYLGKENPQGPCHFSPTSFRSANTRCEGTRP